MQQQVFEGGVSASDECYQLFWMNDYINHLHRNLGLSAIEEEGIVFVQ